MWRTTNKDLDIAVEVIKKAKILSASGISAMERIFSTLGILINIFEHEQKHCVWWQCMPFLNKLSCFVALPPEKQ